MTAKSGRGFKGNLTNKKLDNFLYMIMEKDDALEAQIPEARVVRKEGKYISIYLACDSIKKVIV